MVLHLVWAQSPPHTQIYLRICHLPLYQGSGWLTYDTIICQQPVNNLSNKGLPSIPRFGPQSAVTTRSLSQCDSASTMHGRTAQMLLRLRSLKPQNRRLGKKATTKRDMPPLIPLHESCSSGLSFLHEDDRPRLNSRLL